MRKPTRPWWIYAGSRTPFRWSGNIWFWPMSIGNIGNLGCRLRWMLRMMCLSWTTDWRKSQVAAVCLALVDPRGHCFDPWRTCGTCVRDRMDRMDREISPCCWFELWQVEGIRSEYSWQAEGILLWGMDAMDMAPISHFVQDCSCTGTAFPSIVVSVVSLYQLLSNSQKIFDMCWTVWSWWSWWSRWNDQELRIETRSQTLHPPYLRCTVKLLSPVKNDKQRYTSIHNDTQW